MYRSEKIKGKQAELGLSVEELAEKAKVNANTVSAIRNGKSVTTDSLEKVLGALGLTFADIANPTQTTEVAQV